MNLNRLTLIGRITDDPQLKKTKNGKHYTRFSVATTEVFGRSDGKKESTEFHQCVAWDKIAQNICKYVKKGQSILVEGPIRTNSYTDQNNQKKSVKLLNVLNVQFGSKPRAKNQETSAKAPDEQTKTQETKVQDQPVEEDLDLPF
ncbi:MAG: single-stranded DNA-binding protein [candidate division Zixibacteria bacterium]|nr:single-stranded DNA-binding protein [candidate division Zixibacteria bacterium]